MNCQPDMILTAVKMFGALALILSLLLGVFYLIKRRAGTESGMSRNKLIRVMAGCYIGAKKNISMVEIPGAVLVLGITNDNITLLSKIEDADLLQRIKTIEGDKSFPSFFDQLQQLSSKFKAHKISRPQND